MTSAPELRVTVSTVISHALVTVTGSITLGADKILSDHLNRAFDLTRTAVIVDLTGVDFCDSSGLSVFAAAARKARSHSMTLIACGLSGRVRNVFAITRLTEAIYVHPDVETAVTWLEFPSRPSIPAATTPAAATTRPAPAVSADPAA